MLYHMSCLSLPPIRNQQVFSSIHLPRLKHPFPRQEQQVPCRTNIAAIYPYQLLSYKTPQPYP